MAHLRKQIRDNIVTVLTNLTTTGARVFASRVYPLASDKMPGLCIYTGSETIENATIHSPRTQMRTMEVMVEAYAIATSALDDTLDQICLEVEEKLALDVTRGGKAKDTKVIQIETEFAGDGEKPAGIARITVEVLYAAKENDLEVAV